MSSQELDARNSIKKSLNFFEKVADRYNDESFKLVSYSFSEFHYAFAEPFDLPFQQKSDCQFTAENARIIFRDCKSALNAAISGWKTSGNGKGNINEDYVRFNGTEYAKDLDFDEEIVWVDDDRYDFCKNNLSVGYFWCMV